MIWPLLVIYANLASEFEPLTESYSQVRSAHTASEATFWQSETSIAARVPSGVGATHTISVTTTKAAGTVTEASSYGTVFIPVFRMVLASERFVV
jgi:hypothetical protein